MWYKRIVSLFGWFVLMAAFLYACCRYVFPFKEQLQMFQATSQYAMETLGRAGGLALYLSEFVAQFYVVLWTGPFVTALLLTIITFLTTRILWQINRRDDLPLLACLPCLALLFLHIDYDYYEQGTFAYLFLLLFLWLYVSLKSCKLRLFYGIFAIPVLYGIAGPVVHLFALCAWLFELLTEGKNRYPAAIYVIVAGLCALAGLHGGFSRNLTAAFFPDDYCNPLRLASGIYYAWWALPVVMLLSFALRKRWKAPVSWKGKTVWEGMQWLIVLLLAYQSLTHSEKWYDQESMKQDYSIRMGQWEQVIAEFNQEHLSKRRMCGLNLALAHQGQLSERLFDYPQQGIETLMLRWDQSVYTAQLHSDLYYCMGIISASQKFAFEALVSSHPSGNPRMLKRLVETNLIMGAYATAEKYIRLLENTWYYREWATAQRRFLYQDERVEQDKILGLKRRCWQAEVTAGKFYSNPVGSLMELLPVCPDNQAGLAYLTAFLLLNKDSKMYGELVETLYRTPAWREMTTCQQEAVVIYRPNDLRFWLEHGVSIKVRNQAIRFMQEVQQLSRSGQNPARALAAEYGKTYWYYYMFNTAEK